MADKPFDDDPLWYKDGIIYQLHVRSFFDGNNNGIGDFPGLTQKLDYLQDLGVTALWLLPFYPSPLKDDGYDTADYTGINPIYGTMRDFRVFLREAHTRGLRVITELVINHSSDQHPWFQRARRAKPGTAARDFYVWSDSPEKYKEARIIFKDFETSNWSWDPVAQSYYWHRFYHHQPDLNFDNPEVHRAVFQALDFWMEMGVDGLRLDAIPYLYEREATSCENLPETHAFLKKLRTHVDGKFSDRMLLAEANQWPEDAIPYFGNGDECHVAFHFPLMPRLFMSLAMEDRFPIIDIMQQTPPIPDNCQWAMFLRNHDELTLEMVTDEDRDYMWKAYASNPQARINLGIRRRLAPLLGNHRGRIELMNGLLFAFPGTPIIYYGDEIGMGDNIYLGDRNGVRTPMQWSSDRNAGFSRANPQQMFLPVIIDPEYHFEAINVEAQQGNLHSLLWWTKRLIDLRKRHKAFGRGSLEFLYPENRKVLVFVRRYEDEEILVVANLSRFAQAASIDLSTFRGKIPMELFGQTPFPTITDAPYLLTLGPHNFLWFSLVPATETIVVSAPRKEAPLFEIAEFADLIRGRGKASFASALAQFVTGRRWFGSKSRPVKAAHIIDIIRGFRSRAALVFLQFAYRDGGSELYQVPLAFASGDKATRMQLDLPQDVVARIRTPKFEGVLYDALHEKDFCRDLLDLVASRRQLRGTHGEVRRTRTKLLADLRGLPQSELEPNVSKAEQSNTSILFGQRYFMKLYRKLEAGLNNDLEVIRFLTEKTDFANVPRLAGSLEYQTETGDTIALAILQEFVPSGGDAWSYTIDVIGQYFDRVVREPDLARRIAAEMPQEDFVTLTTRPVPQLARETLGVYLTSAELLGRRTAEMHAALASGKDDPAFRPEPFTPHYQRSIYQQMRTEASAAMPLLRERMHELPEAARAEAERVLGLETEIFKRFRRLLDRKVTTVRIRTHGDFHLGQILQTGKDFIVIDFEGEPKRPLSQRRIKKIGLRDVAGMLRSFNYAPHAVLLGKAPGVTVRSTDIPTLELAATYWQRWVSAAYLRSYLEAAHGSDFVPPTLEEAAVLLDAYLLEKALYELTYELNSRPEWVRIPLQGILDLVAPSR